MAALCNKADGATYIRQGGHQFGHWPTFLVIFVLAFSFFWYLNLSHSS